MRAFLGVVGRGALWSSFVMVFRLRRMLESAAPAPARGHLEARAPARRPRRLRGRVPPWNFWRDFLARIPEHLAVGRTAGMGWSDRGTPAAIAPSGDGRVPALAGCARPASETVADLLASKPS